MVIKKLMFIQGEREENAPDCFIPLVGVPLAAAPLPRHNLSVR